MTTRFCIRLLAMLLLSSFAITALAATQPIKGVGIGKTQEQAERAAYEFVLLQALERYAGMQARQELGRRYRVRLERNFDELKRAYFSPDTDSECITQKNAKIRCQIRGLLILTALQSDIRKHTKSTERRISNRLVFFLAAPAGLTKSGQFVLDRFEGAVVKDGHRIIYGRKARRLIKKRQVDFGLAIEELSFTPAQYDRYDQRLTGTLTIRFKLNDLKNDQRLAATPLTVTSEISGSDGPALKAELDALLADYAARQLARSVFESVINHQEESAADKAALSRKASGGVEYTVRLIGVSRRDRKIIRGIRKTIKTQFAPASPTTSHQLSDESQVTLLFTVPEALDPDDLLDSLFEQATQSPNFDAQYLGNNVFEVQWE